jgi:hypothetical protein
MLKKGTQAADTITGTDSGDVIYRYDPNGAESTRGWRRCDCRLRRLKWRTPLQPPVGR